MVNKKSLIELFESKIPVSDITNFYIQTIEGDSENVNGVEYYAQKQIDYKESKSNSNPFSNHCKIYVFIESNGKFFIGFNSLKEEITQKEYIHLKRMVDLRKKHLTQRLKEKKQQIDLQLLEMSFSEKTNKEKRNILSEKKIYNDSLERIVDDKLLPF